MIDATITIGEDERSILAFDTESAPRWYWYDGKTTTRTMIFVGQWVAGDGEVQMPPFGWIILPRLLVNNRAYRGLPTVTREVGLRRISQTVADADVLVGHNIKGFDLGNINGELKLLGLPLMPQRTVVDTLKDAVQISGQSMSLANRMTRIPGEQKPHVDPVVWERAFNEFEPDALREVWERACADVGLHIDLYRHDTEKGYLA